MSKNYNDWSDRQLVEAWKKDRDETALNTLVTKYYPLVFRRLKGKLARLPDAEEVTQDAFIKLVNSLDNYNEEGKFTHFLQTIVSSQLIDFYRKNDKYSSHEELDEAFHIDVSLASGDAEEQLSMFQKIEYLTTHCIPKLPVQERLVFLLMHESEFWDFDSPLEWSHMAMLNGIDKETAWSRFESAREALMKGISRDKIDKEELLIFLVWTEAKRPFKASQTLKYFANLLGEAEQNLRNRSHKAKKVLDACLADYAQ